MASTALVRVRAPEIREGCSAGAPAERCSTGVSHRVSSVAPAAGCYPGGVELRYCGEWQCMPFTVDGDMERACRLVAFAAWSVPAGSSWVVPPISMCSSSWTSSAVPRGRSTTPCAWRMMTTLPPRRMGVLWRSRCCLTSSGWAALRRARARALCHMYVADCQFECRIGQGSSSQTTRTLQGSAPRWAMFEKRDPVDAASPADCHVGRVPCIVLSPVLFLLWLPSTHAANATQLLARRGCAPRPRCRAAAALHYGDAAAAVAAPGLSSAEPPPWP